MEAFLCIEITGIPKNQARLDRLGPGVRSSLVSKMSDLMSNLQVYIQTEKLSGQVLHVRTGALRSSIQFKVEATETAVIGTVFSSGVPYAAIHEYGGTIHVPSRPSKSRVALHGQYGGITRMTKAYDIHIPERSYMRSSVNDKQAFLLAGVKDAVIAGLRLQA